jgi:hypothetical protein
MNTLFVAQNIKCRNTKYKMSKYQEFNFAQNHKQVAKADKQPVLAARAVKTTVSAYFP